jgi:hypothetical protein
VFVSFSLSPFSFYVTLYFCLTDLVHLFPFLFVFFFLSRVVMPRSVAWKP